LLVVFRHCEPSDLSAEAQRAKAEAIHSTKQKLDLLRRLDPLRKRFAFLAGNDRSLIAITA
jgi:hypothetical protein